MQHNISFFILAGEPSGDIHGRTLIEALKQAYPKTSYKGVGGPLMRSQGLELFFPMEELQLMGFQEIFMKAPFILKKLFSLKNRILREKPDACILIDFPDFNLFLARLLRKGGYQGKIIQMIPPTVWAWRKGRIKTLEKNFDLLLSIFPFEKEIYKNTKLPVTYIGNPVFEDVINATFDPNFREKNHLPKDTKIISLFPGSRKGEVELNLPKQLETLKALKNELEGFSFAVSIYNKNHLEDITTIINAHGFTNKVTLIPAEKRYDLMRESSFALAKSGTVTLELALNGCPHVVTYETSWLNYMIAKYVVRLKIPYFSIANILLKEEAYPEHIADLGPIEAVANSTKTLLFNEQKRAEVLANTPKMHQILSGVNPKEAIAKAIKSLL